MVSDGFRVQDVDDIVYEVDAAMITVQDGEVDIGGNPSAEEQQEALDGISAHGVSVRAGDRTILHPTSLEVPVGRLVGMIGPSGSGKSTLLRAMAGVLVPAGGIQDSTGAIEMANTEIADGSNPDALEMARTIVATQQQEIDTMQRLLG